MVVEVAFLDSMPTKMYAWTLGRFSFVKWRTSICLSRHFCDLLDAATFNALLIEFFAASLIDLMRFH